MNFPKPFIKKSHVCIVMFVAFTMPSFSQIQEPVNDFWSHVRFGGALGLSFGDGFFSGTIAPTGIYEFNSRFAAGVGLNGTYSKQDDFFKSTVLGGSILGLYNPMPELQVSTEFEYFNVNQKFESVNFRDRNYWYPALFLGIGYGNRNVTFGIRYDVLYDRDRSIYADPWAPFIRAFF